METSTGSDSHEENPVIEACRLLTEAANAHDDAGDGNAVGPVLEAIAAAGGTDLSYLTGVGGEPSPRDIRTAIGHLEALAGLSWTMASIYMINPVIAGALIAAGGSAEQRQRLLPQIQSGDRQFAFAMTEPAAGSDAASIQTEATRVAGGFVIRGQKHYITGADSADDLLVVARTGETRRSFTLFLVPQSAAGVKVEIQAKLAMHPHSSCRISFEEVEVPEDSVLGGIESVDAAWPLLRYTGSLERTAVAAMAAGSAGAVVQRCLDFATGRIQFGQPIAMFQSIQHMLVDMVSSHKVMELLVQDALDTWERDGDVTRAASTAKYLCAEHLQEIVGRAMRVLGGRAFFDHEEMSRLYREAPFALYAGGTNEIQRNLVARSLGLISR